MTKDEKSKISPDPAVELDDEALDEVQGGALSYTDLKKTTLTTNLDDASIRKLGIRVGFRKGNEDPTF